MDSVAGRSSSSIMEDAEKMYDKKKLLRHVRESLVKGRTPVLQVSVGQRNFVFWDLNEVYKNFKPVIKYECTRSKLDSEEFGALFYDLPSLPWGTTMGLNDLHLAWSRREIPKEDESPIRKLRFFPRIIMARTPVWNVWMDFGRTTQDIVELKRLCEQEWGKADLMFVGMPKADMTEFHEWVKGPGGRLDIVVEENYAHPN